MRQLILANDTFRKMLSIESYEPILGKRPGEIVNCIHSQKSHMGCGTTEDCEFCGAVKVVLESQKTGETVEEEDRLITEKAGSDAHYDLLVTSNPLEINGEFFFMVTMVDITSQKRKRTMERVFFHDVMNTALGLMGTLDFMEEIQSVEQMKTMIKTSQRITENLVKEISYHKDIIAAESGDLKFNNTQFLSVDILEETIRPLSKTKVAKGKTMIIDSDSQRFTIETDERLLRRVLINMTRNALEASEEGDQIRMKCGISGNWAEFSVWNREVMKPEVKAQLWQRSFSTKGPSRGIGTYSMKIFTEQYLKGRIEFVSEPGKGTTFIVRLHL